MPAHPDCHVEIPASDLATLSRFSACGRRRQLSTMPFAPIARGHGMVSLHLRTSRVLRSFDGLIEAIR
jgi:hypothetical protein